MPRNRLFFTAPIVLAIVVIGVFAIKSRGNDNHADVKTTPTKNCPPVARADAVATKPGTPISIDVLANDTDPDGDPLVFQIRNTTGGDSTVDDGGTPTEASDDRVLFTPADPPPPVATIDYEALDPDGAISESTATVYVNADGLLPPDVRSEAVPTDPNGPSENGCGTGRVATTETSTDVTTETTIATSPDESQTATTTSSSSGGRHTSTTTKKGTKPKPTTSTTKPPSSSTTRPTTTQTTTPPPTSSTSTTQPKPDPCGDYPFNGTEEQQQKWIDCEQAHNGGG